MNYKAPDNSLHFIEPQYAHLLPTGSIAITDEEAEALRPKSAAPTYVELRAAAYPSIVEQLDMIYHDFDTWQSAVAAVKVQYPKP